jgi:O-antigen/teichoic acid export membrane protein
LNNTTNKGNQSNTYQALWVGIASFNSFALAIVSAAILSRYLDKTEYGTYRQIIYVYNSLLIIFTAGLPSVFNYFLPRFNRAQGKEIVFNISKVLFVAGLLFSVFLFVSSGLIAKVLDNPELSRGLKYFSPVPMLLLPTLGIDGIFTTYRKTVYIAIYSTLTRVFMLILIVLPVIIFTQNYIYAIYGWIASSVLILIMAYYFKGIPFKGLKGEKSDLKFKEILNYSVPLVFASLGGIIFRSSNQFFISRYFGPEAFAEFSNGFIEIPFVHMITGATAAVLMPVFSKAVHEKDFGKITVLWRSALNKSVVLIYPIVIYMLFYSNELITIVFSEAYSVSAKFFTAAIIINFFNVIVFAPLLLSLGKTRFYAWLQYGKAIAIWSLQYVAILVFNTPMSIAITYVIISVIAIIFPLGYVARIFKVTIFDLFPVGRVLVISLHSFMSMFLVNLLLRQLMPEVSPLLFMLIAGMAYAGILVLSSRFFKINYWDIVSPLLNRKGKQPNI